MSRTILDTHFHLWDATKHDYPWVRSANNARPVGSSPLPQRYECADYLRDARGSGLEAFVHVEAGRLADEAVDETSWLNQLSYSSFTGVALVVSVDLTSPQLEHQLQRHREAAPGRVCGIRQTVAWDPDGRASFAGSDLLAEPAFQRGMRALRDRALSFDLLLFPHQVGNACGVIAANDSVRFIVNHMGLPGGRDPASVEIWSAAMARLAALPNVAMKVSGFGLFVPQHRSPDVVSVIQRIVQMFGPARVMFGSNVPVEGSGWTMTSMSDTWRTAIAPYTEAEKRELCTGAARRWYYCGSAAV